PKDHGRMALHYANERASCEYFRSMPPLIRRQGESGFGACSTALPILTLGESWSGDRTLAAGKLGKPEEGGGCAMTTRCFGRPPGPFEARSGWRWAEVGRKI